MKNHLLGIGAGLLLLLTGYKIAEYGDRITSQEEIDNYREFCENAAFTTGFLKDSVTETTTKVGKIKAKSYEFRYSFTAGEGTYEARSVLNRESAPEKQKVWYNINNPAHNETSDPCQRYEKLSKEKTVGNKWLFYAPGGLMMLVGFGLGWTSVKKFLRSFFLKKENL